MVTFRLLKAVFYTYWQAVMCFALLVYVGHAFCIFVLFLLCIFLLSLSFVYLEIHLDFTLKASEHTINALVYIWNLPIHENVKGPEPSGLWERQSYRKFRNIGIFRESLGNYLIVQVETISA
jgi:hypothetical protein